jgi:transposase
VKDVLGSDHLCFVVHGVVEACDLGAFDKQGEDAGGQRPYDPWMMLKIWLYGFCVNVRTTRKWEQRIRAISVEYRRVPCGIPTEAMLS